LGPCFSHAHSGQRDYVCHLAQLTNGFVTYGLLDVIMSLITQAKPWIDEVMAYGGKYTDNEWRQRLDQETAIHGVISKSTDPGSAIRYYVDMIADSRDRKFTACIESSGQRRLFQAKDKLHKDYTTQGPRAYDYQDGRRNEMDDVRLVEYETSKYPIGGDGRWTDPLKHPCVTVAYHPMQPVDYTTPENYRTANDCMMLLDHKTDSLFKLGVVQMLENCGLFDENGDLADGADGFFNHVFETRPRTFAITSFGDYLRFNGIFRSLCEATNLALARARKANDINALQQFSRLWRLTAPRNPARNVFPDQARHRGLSAKDRAMAAKKEIQQLAQADTVGYRTLFGSLSSFNNPAAGQGVVTAAFADFPGNHVPAEPCVLEFFEALAEMLSDKMKRGEYKAVFDARRMLATKVANGVNRFGYAVGDTDFEAVFGEREIGEMFNNQMIETLTLAHFKWFAANDVQIPLRFMAIRYCYDIMAMMIVGIPGSSTGNLCLGDGNFQLSHNGSQKMLYGYAHIWIGCVINDRENIALLPNVRAVAYVKGASKEIWNPASETDIQTYLRGGGVSKDIFIVPLQPCEVLEDNFDLTGKNPEGITETRDFDYAARALMQRYWGWIAPHSPYVDRDVFSEQRAPTRVFRGCTYYPDPDKGSNSVARVRYGKGHWPVMYAGSVAIRNGCGDTLLLEKPKGLMELADIVSYDYAVGG
jgi:hypothetical protein